MQVDVSQLLVIAAATGVIIAETIKALRGFQRKADSEKEEARKQEEILKAIRSMGTIVANEVKKARGDLISAIKEDLALKDQYWRDRMDNWSTIVTNSVNASDKKLDQVAQSLVDLIRNM